ncbi:cobalamin biosynthesis protein CobW [Reticulomyxa filosa]|uniref:Cobalamin biosynthesis protein CobW n=1 Tax=Reticulomyxa filosa TaxID=46433 RepID=X6L9X2_RETFI|nr:cobalamin biosynthesis protein CobW [Reticulomyxa filosa]|eukprot:ETN98328.1 cobalamin biosynthesis protein CobW [Reticulomyxa filosa]
MTTQGETNTPYSDLSGQPNAAYSTGFVAVGEQPQYPQLPPQQFGTSVQSSTVQTTSQVYVQPSYVMGGQPQVQVVEQKPVVDRHSAIMAQLHHKNCCGCFSYPTGVKIVAAIQIVSWFIWGIAFAAAQMWWMWIFAVAAIVMCYYGFTGATHLNERHLRMYFYYLVCMTVLDFVLIIVFISAGYASGIAGWVISTLVMIYWCYIVRDFIRIIHEVDYGQGSFLAQYRNSLQEQHHHHHHDDHHHEHHHHHDDHHDDHH